jgi:predicted RNA-binding Zn-ribbon protein involved in translation (DUF1610 family)
MMKVRQDIVNNIEKILNGSLKIHYCSSIRNQILKNKIFDYKCDQCEINTWNNIKLSLEIDHVDGDKWNNKKENLRLLCPNCHSVTHNYRSKKYKQNKEFYSDEVLINRLKEGGTINSILVDLGLSNSGGNYKRIYQICKKYQIQEPKKHTIKIKTLNEINNEKISQKIKELQLKINLITTSNINFDKRGWVLEVSKLLNIKPQSVKQWMVREIPEFHKNCYHHADNIRFPDYI